MNWKERKRRKNLITSIDVSYTLFLLISYFTGYAVNIAETEHVPLPDGFFNLYFRLKAFNLIYKITPGVILSDILTAAFCFFIGYSFYIDMNKRITLEGAHGSARFQTAKEMEEYNHSELEKTPEEIEAYRNEYLTEYDKSMGITRGDEPFNINDFDGCIQSMNHRRNIRATNGTNNNFAIIGPPGSYKTRGALKPNILQMQGSLVINDPSGEMIADLGHALSMSGYIIKIFNVSDVRYSNMYNPLEYIRTEDDIKKMVDVFMDNTTKPNETSNDPFFPNAEKLCYCAMVGYLWEFEEDPNRKNWGTVLKMMINSKDHALDNLFNTLPRDSFAYQNYAGYSEAPEKTRASISTSVFVRMGPFMSKSVRNLTHSDEMELGEFGKKRMALFIINNQTSKTYDFLSSMLIAQFLQTNYAIGDELIADNKRADNHIPIRMLLDEFKNTGYFKTWPTILSTCRKYGILVTLVLQSTTQLDTMFDKEAEEIRNNVFETVILGLADKESAKYFSDLFGNEEVSVSSINMKPGTIDGPTGSSVQTISKPLLSVDEGWRMELNECYILPQHARPIKDKKYRYEEHPRYCMTAEYDAKNLYSFKQNLLYDNNRKVKKFVLIKAMSEIRRYCKENNRALEKGIDYGKTDNG